MNKELFDQLPADEQSVAAKLNSAADNMKVPQDFQWKLETQLMDAHQNKSQPAKGWFAKLIVPVAWTFAAVLGFFLLNWTIRSIIPSKQAPGSSSTEIPLETFESNVRQGNMCEGPLALAHGFSAFMSNSGKTEFVDLDPQRTIGELRSLSWSPNGEQLALVGNTTGTGNIYLTDSAGRQLQPVLSNSELGYLMDVAWSRDGKRLLTWSVQNNTIVYLMNTDGSGLVEIQLDMQIFGTPQFTPDGKSIVYYGVDSTTDGLFEFLLDGSQTRLINDLVEDDSGFAFSPDGSRLAYVAMDRVSGGAILMVHDLETRAILALPGGLPIPKGSGSSIPNAAHLSWSKDGTKLVFEFGTSMTDRAIYLAYVDGTALVKLANSAHAPTISSDGNCLAFISDKQVFLLDLTDISLTSVMPTPIILADLSAGRSIPDFRLDTLQWAK